MPVRWAPTSFKQLVTAELALLQRVIRKSRCRSSHIPLANGEFINTLEAFGDGTAAPPHDLDDDAPVVLAHGFGSGLGLWGPSIDGLVAQSPGRRVIAFDWLGMGGSSRPEFTKRRGCHPIEVVQQSEEFFCASLSEWADRIGLRRFKLVGHSLGGYLSGVYALRNPDRISNLVLVSPVGLPSAGEHDLTDDDDTHTGPSDDDTAADATKAASAGIDPEVWKQMPWQMRMIVRAWNYNVTPQGIVRMLGAFGPRIMAAAVGRRLGGALHDPEVQDLVTSYLYHVTASEGSGEFAMNALLAPRVVGGVPGVYARRPIGDRLGSLPMPVTAVFGDNDWMMHADVPRLIGDAGPSAKFVQIASAGHHLYLDNPDDFQAALAKALA